MIKKIKKGFTLIEVLIVLGIAAIVAAAAYFTYNSIRTTNQANEEVRNLVLIKTAIQTVYASQRDYDGVSNSIIASSGFLPSNMNVEAGRIDNTWRNEIIIYNWGPGPNPKPSKSFSIVTIVPKNVCEKVVQGLVAAFDYVDIDTTYMVRSWNGNEPVDATQILAGCTAAGATARVQLGSK